MYNPKIPHSYHISKGADSVFYILNCGEEFVRTLSTNYDTAKKLAVDLIKKNDPDFFQEGNKLSTYIWNRDKWNVSKNFVPTEYMLQHEHIRSYFCHIENVKYKKAIEEAKAKYSHIGDVGDILDLELTITEIFGFDSNYGYCLAHKFEDSNGNTLIYFGNSKELCEDYDSKFKVKDKITITAEIKRHTRDQRTYVDEYMEVLKPVTVISKPKLIKERN